MHNSNVRHKPLARTSFLFKKRSLIRLSKLLYPSKVSSNTQGSQGKDSDSIVCQDHTVGKSINWPFHLWIITSSVNLNLYTSLMLHWPHCRRYSLLRSGTQWAVPLYSVPRWSTNSTIFLQKMKKKVWWSAHPLVFTSDPISSVATSLSLTRPSAVPFFHTTWRDTTAFVLQLNV